MAGAVLGAVLKPAYESIPARAALAEHASAPPLPLVLGPSSPRAPTAATRLNPTPPAQTEPKSPNERTIPVIFPAAAIATMLVQESRNAYYATGHPCACPDDLMRNGRRCGGNSAYLRPGGAQPLCSVADVSPEMIAQYRARLQRVRN
jgi:hypothetical protein